MKIELKLFASLKECQPQAKGGILNIEVADGTTPRDLIDQYNIPMESVHLLLINGTYVAPDQSDGVTLQEGDVVAMWPPIAGG